MTGHARMDEKRYLVCGGCGFIGSNFIRHLVGTLPESTIVIYDLLTYAGSLDNLEGLHDRENIKFVAGDICDSDKLNSLFERPFDLVLNFAAETHVDRSFYYTTQFVRSNVLGTEILLTACRQAQSPLLHISTDEVYGPAAQGQVFDEEAPLSPTSPYAASKAAADLLLLAAIRTFGQPVTIVRTSNNYGPRQFPEKLIPFFIYLAAHGEHLPVYGDGMQRRSWLHVDDFCSALLKLVIDFPAGEVFNLGSATELPNIEVAQQLASHFKCTDSIEYVTDRPAHDRRYLMDSAKYVSRFGEIVQRDFSLGLKQTIDWYMSHPEIFSRLRADHVRLFREKHYRNR